MPTRRLIPLQRISGPNCGRGRLARLRGWFRLCRGLRRGMTMQASTMKTSRWKLLRTIAACALVLVLTPVVARAQAAGESGVILGGPLLSAGLARQMTAGDATARPSTIRDSLDALGAAASFAALTMSERFVQRVGDMSANDPPNDQRGYGRRSRRGGRGDRAAIGLMLGVVGGLVAGGAIGIAVAEDSCHCDNPALHGFAIGAPIGAVVGGFIGYAIAR
jgi:hypothetical protein